MKRFATPAKAVLVSAAAALLLAGCAWQSDLDQLRTDTQAEIQALKSQLNKVGQTADKAATDAMAASTKADKMFRESLRK